ncbi:MAG: WxL domain-containing protein [Streptococcaceae bacterium]|jgi:hypothetical protein|nr:WxL domain-containing protein [Streptococcaceae bacterium]
MKATRSTRHRAEKAPVFQFAGMVLFLLVSLVLTTPSAAQSVTEGGAGRVQFVDGNEAFTTYPEDPTQVVDPGRGDSEEGDLRLDYVPYLIFDQTKVGTGTTQLTAHAQYYADGHTPTGNFAQVTDARRDSSGWVLSVTQETAFTHESQKDQTLKGTVLSIGHIWTNSIWLTSQTTGEPRIDKDRIDLTPGKSCIIAKAGENAGHGRWSIAFGSTGQTQRGGEQTVWPQYYLDKTPVLLKDSHPVIQSYGYDVSQQQAYYNTAITLIIPAQKENLAAGVYHTSLLWRLVAAP